jgi:hypothetical protein
MGSLRDFVGQELQWMRTNVFKRIFELHAGEQCLATLQQSGLFRQVTVAESDGRRWRFKCQGYLKVVPVIFEDAEEASTESAPLASFKRQLRGGGGDLIFSDGHKYTWSCTGLLSLIWTMAGPEGTLFTLKKSRLLEIAPAANNLPDLPLLVLFSLYLILREEQEAGA